MGTRVATGIVTLYDVADGEHAYQSYLEWTGTTVLSAGASWQGQTNTQSLTWAKAANAGAWSPTGIYAEYDTVFVRGGVEVGRRRSVIKRLSGTVDIVKETAVSSATDYATHRVWSGRATPSFTAFETLSLSGTLVHSSQPINFTAVSGGDKGNRGAGWYTKVSTATGWGDALANTACPLDTPQINDRVTLYNETESETEIPWSTTKFYNASNSWEGAALVIDGSLIVKDTVSADKLLVNEAMVTELFAEDVTATGTITGATLVGGKLTIGTVGTGKSVVLDSSVVDSSPIHIRDGDNDMLHFVTINENTANERVVLKLSGGLGPQTIDSTSVFTQDVLDVLVPQVGGGTGGVYNAPPDTFVTNPTTVDLTIESANLTQPTISVTVTGSYTAQVENYAVPTWTVQIQRKVGTAAFSSPIYSQNVTGTYNFFSETEQGTTVTFGSGRLNINVEHVDNTSDAVLSDSVTYRLTLTKVSGLGDVPKLKAFTVAQSVQGGGVGGAATSLNGETGTYYLDYDNFTNTPVISGYYDSSNFGQTEINALNITAYNSGLLNGVASGTASELNTIVKRDASANIRGNTFKASVADQDTIDGAMAFRSNNSTLDHVRFCDDVGAIRTYLSTYSKAEADLRYAVIGTDTGSGVYLPLSGGTLTGDLTVDTKVVANEIRCRTGSQLVISAGEAHSAAENANQIGEILYVNAEGGLQVNSSATNWADTDGAYYTPAAWAARGIFSVNATAITYNGNTVYHAGNIPSYMLASEGANFVPATRDMVLTLSGDASGTATFTNMGDATLNLTVADDSHSHSQLFIPDTRGAVRPPWYYPDKHVSYDFQQNTDTLAGDDDWHVLQTVAKWSGYFDTIPQQQIAYTGPQLKHRTATSDTTWGAWKTIWDSSNFGKTQIDGLQVNAYQLGGKTEAQFVRSDVDDTKNGKLWLGGQITGSSAALQVNGFTRMGSIYLHEGSSPSDLESGLNKLLDNSGGNLRWDTNTVYHSGNLPAALSPTGDSTITGSFLADDPFTTTDWNTNWRSGFYETNGGANSPTTTGWYWGLKAGHSNNNASNRYGMDIVIQNGGSSTPFIRSTPSNGAGTWQQIYTSTNFGKTQIDALGINASTVTNGVYTNTTQSISGAKTFSNSNNHYRGHLHFDEYTTGRHYLHFNSTAATNQIDWRIGVLGNSTYAVHAWRHDKTIFGNSLEVTGTVTPSVGLARSAHNTGHMIGGYNNIGSNGANTNPIYTIGSSYNPTSTALTNMYGIGYTKAVDATFINATDLGDATAAGWGMYVAADGNARIFLDATSGKGFFKGAVVAQQIQTRGVIVAASTITGSDAIATSDIRVKQDLQPITNAAEKLRTLRTTTHERTDYEKVDGKYPRKASVIAQDVEAVLPEAISYTDDEKLGQKLNVSVPATVVMTIAAVNEHTDTIAAQAKKIVSLEDRLAKLEALLING